MNTAHFDGLRRLLTRGCWLPVLCPYGFIPRQRQKAISVICLFLCLLAAPLFARSSYPPTFKDARVETYRKIGSTELKLWIFGESERQAKKPAIVLFFGGGWNAGSPAQFENQARHFAKRGMIAITADYRVKSHFKTAPAHAASGKQPPIIRRNPQ